MQTRTITQSEIFANILENAKKLQQELNTKEKAIAFFQELGVLDPNGQITPEYQRPSQFLPNPWENDDFISENTEK